MNKTSRNRGIFSAAKEYLLTFEGIDDSIINKHLDLWKKNNIDSLSGLFRAMLESAKNRQGMPYSIGDVDALRKILYGFDSQRVIGHYGKWEDVFDVIKKSVHPPGRMVKSNPHNFWVIYCKSIISIALFVNRFASIAEFKKYVDQFVKSSTPDTRIALPLLLQEEIFGYKFTLACDFLKEYVDPHFVKPDTHIKDIFVGLNFSIKTASDFQVFRDVIDFAESIEELPYAVDKLFWLIGSGNFYDSKIQIATSKEHFINSARKLL